MILPSFELRIYQFPSPGSPHRDVGLSISIIISRNRNIILGAYPPPTAEFDTPILRTEDIPIPIPRSPHCDVRLSVSIIISRNRNIVLSTCPPLLRYETPILRIDDIPISIPWSPHCDVALSIPVEVHYEFRQQDRIRENPRWVSCTIFKLHSNGLRPASSL